MIEASKTKSGFASAALVIYEFGPWADVDLHFHEVADRSFFFFPAELPQRDGQWIFVEFLVAGSDVPCLARGRVRTQQAATVVGSWLEFPMLGLPTMIKNLATTRRTHERLPIDVTASVRCADGARLLCRVADASIDGLRLSGLPLLLNAGEDVSVEIIGIPRAQSDLGRGRVVWARPQEAGIQFASADARRRSLVELVEQATAARSTATSFVHADTCGCKYGERPLEPPIPGVAKR